MTDCKLSQWHILNKDRWLLVSLTLLPVLLALFLWWIFSQSIVRNLPVAVVDLQQSVLSRQLIRNINATSELDVTQSLTDVGMAKNAFIGNEIYGYVVIPKHFDRDIYLGMTPQVTAFYNSQFILVGKLINKALLVAHGNFDAQVGIVKELNKGNRNISSAFGQAVAIRTQITPLFNQNASYAQFLLSGIIPALWQISIILSTVLFLTANHRIYGAQKMLRDNYFKQYFSISFFYLPFFLIQGASFLVCFYVMLDWPMFGSFVTLFFAQLVTTVACMIMGGLFFFLTLDPTRAMSFAAVFTAPSFAFMGVTFPVTDMELPAKIWRNLLPVSHYIEAQINQVSYGATTWETIAQFIPSMSYYLIPLLLLTLLINKHHKQLDVKNETE